MAKSRSNPEDFARPLRRIFTALLVLLSTVAAIPAYAQEPVPNETAAEDRDDVIVVTANRREENLQDVSGVVQTLGADQLRRDGISDWQAWRLRWNVLTIASAGAWGLSGWLFYTRGLGIQQQRLRDEVGGMFVVTDTQVRYLRPARLDDLLLVTARVLEVCKASLTIRQSALLKAQQVGETDVLLCEGSIRIGWVNTATMRPQRIPTAVLDVMPLPGSPIT